MNVLFITPSYLPAAGGAERQTALLGTALRARGHQVTILTEKRDGLPKRRETDAGTVLRVLPGAVHPRFYAAATILTTAAWLLRHGRRFDVVQCMFFSVHTVACALLAPFFHWRWGARLACTGRFGELGAFPHGVRRRLLRLALNRADRLIALSGAAAEEMRTFGIRADPIIVLPNAVDAERFQCPNRTHERCEKLLFVGRLAEQKNLNALLEAMATPGLEGCRLTLAGTGEAGAELAEFARRLGIADRVDFRGEVEAEAMPRLYCEHDLFVLPSFAEGMSNALLEAMASGLPCVCTPVGGAPDIIEPGVNGILTEDTTAEAVARGVTTAVHATPVQRAAWGRAAATQVRDRHSAERTAELLEELYSTAGDSSKSDRSGVTPDERCGRTGLGGTKTPPARSSCRKGKPASMNILFLVPSYLPEIGGAQRQAELLAHELVRRGHAVTILTRRRQDCPDAETSDGVHIRRVFPAHAPRPLYSAAMILSTALFLLRHGCSFDAVHSFRLCVHNLAVALLQPLFGWRWLARMSGGGPSGDLAPVPPGMRRRLLCAALNRAHVLLALSNEMRNEMIAFGLDPARIHLASNAVDTMRFACPERDYRRFQRLLFIGRLAPEKNLHALFEALTAPHLEGCALTVAGDGPERVALAGSARRLGLADRVTFLGGVNDVAALYGAHDVFVLPSLAEGMSNALLEAMASGLPCVCTPVGGAPDIIEPGVNGILTQGTTAEAVARGLTAAVRATPEQRAAWGRAA
ncbi:MAG: glycosyltransferase family 4 protein, partial [Kiritimatiellaeota bacterium]|nr:glycosyltransferase family 4 protein [Kiritimatiellota bacterium]